VALPSDARVPYKRSSHSDVGPDVLVEAELELGDDAEVAADGGDLYRWPP
jgi:hypothetical protein